MKLSTVLRKILFVEEDEVNYMFSALDFLICSCVMKALKFYCGARMVVNLYSFAHATAYRSRKCLFFRAGGVWIRERKSSDQNRVARPWLFDYSPMLVHIQNIVGLCHVLALGCWQICFVCISVDPDIFILYVSMAVIEVSTL